MSKSVDYFYKHLPWNFITKYHEGVVIQKDGLLQRTFAYRAPDVDSSDSSEINTLAVRVNDFSMRLGSGWAFHLEAQRFQIQEYPKADFDSLAPFLVDRERDASFNAAGRHFDSSYYLTFTYKPPSESIKKLASLFVQSASGGVDSTSVKQNVEFFVNESNAFVSLLANELLIAPLDNIETIAYLHSSVSFNKHPIRFPHTRILLDRILSDCELENSIPMKLGDYYIPIVGINDFPDETYPAILDSLNRARLEYRWVTRYICLDKDEGVKEARKKEKSHRGSRTTFLQTFAEQTTGEAAKAVNHGAGVKEGDSIEAGIEIDTDKASLGYLTTCVMVWDKSLNVAVKKSELVRTVINSKGFTCVDEKYNAFESFKSMLPGQIYANYRALPVMSNTMSHIVPLSSVWAGNRSNDHAYQVTGCDIPHIVCSTVEGSPFFLNLCVGDVEHTSILGPTGAGKSTLLNLITIQALKYPGSLVITFDKDRSCRQTCLSVGGLFYEPAADNAAGVCFQPLRDLETDRDMMNAQDFIEACITANGENVPPQMSTEIKKSLELLKDIKEPHRRTITSFVQYVKYHDPVTKKPVLKDLLMDYTIEGKFGKIFDAKVSDLSMNTRFLAVEMGSLMSRGEKCIVPALVYLFNFVEKKFDGRLTYLILDEAWLFLKNETFADKITEWLKVLRKKNVGVIFATQEIADVVNSPLKTTIIQQCMTKIYLADPSALTPGMAEVYQDFGLTESELYLIANSRMKHDYFYTSPLGRRLFQLNLGPLALAIIGSPNHALLDELALRYEHGSALCEEILNYKNINYRRYLDKYSPADPAPVPRKKPAKVIHQSNAGLLKEKQDVKKAPEEKADASVVPNPNIAEFMEAVTSLSKRKNKGGSGSAAKEVAALYNVSVSTVYQALAVIKSGNPQLLESLKKGVIKVKTAYKQLEKLKIEQLYEVS